MVTYRGEQLALIPLAQPAAPTLERFGDDGETTYTYQVVAKRSTGHTEASPLATITTGPTTLARLAAIDIVPPYVQGAEAYDIYRVSGGFSQGKIGSLTAYNSGTTQQARFRDHGQEGDDAEPPTSNTTGLLVLSGLDEGSLVFVDADGGLRALAPSETPGAVVTLLEGLPAWATAPSGSLAIGATITDATLGSVLFVGVDGDLAQDNANFAYDVAEKNLVVGSLATGLTLPKGTLYLAPDPTTGAWPHLYGVGAQNFGLTLVGWTSEGATLDTPVISDVGDMALDLSAGAYNGSNYVRTSILYGGVDAKSDTTLGGLWDFFTTDLVGSTRLRMRIASAGTASVSFPDAGSAVILAGQMELQGDLMQSGAGGKLGLLGAVPVVQQAHIADADLTNVHTRLNSVLDALEAYGLLAVS